MKPQGDYLDLTQTAEVLSVSRRTVARWIDREQLPAFHDGAIYRIHRNDLDAFIEERMTRRTA